MQFSATYRFLSHGTIHISTITFYVLKLSACCREGFYIHALILYIVLAKTRKICGVLYIYRYLHYIVRVKILGHSSWPAVMSISITNAHAS